MNPFVETNESFPQSTINLHSFLEGFEMDVASTNSIINEPIPQIVVSLDANEAHSTLPGNVQPVPHEASLSQAYTEFHPPMVMLNSPNRRPFDYAAYSQYANPPLPLDNDYDMGLGQAQHSPQLLAQQIHPLVIPSSPQGLQPLHQDNVQIPPLSPLDSPSPASPSVTWNSEFFRTDPAYRNPPDDNGFFHCPECPDWMDKKSAEYKKHLDDHILPFYCDLRHEKLHFKQQSGWLRHMREQHDNARGYTVTCPDPHCARSRKLFRRNDNLWDHVWRKHKDLLAQIEDGSNTGMVSHLEKSHVSFLQFARTKKVKRDRLSVDTDLGSIGYGSPDSAAPSPASSVSSEYGASLLLPRPRGSRSRSPSRARGRGRARSPFLGVEQIQSRPRAISIATTPVTDSEKSALVAAGAVLDHGMLYWESGMALDMADGGHSPAASVASTLPSPAVATPTYQFSCQNPQTAPRIIIQDTTNGSVGFVCQADAQTMEQFSGFTFSSYDTGVNNLTAAMETQAQLSSLSSPSMGGFHQQSPLKPPPIFLQDGFSHTPNDIAMEDMLAFSQFSASNAYPSSPSLAPVLTPNSHLSPPGAGPSPAITVHPPEQRQAVSQLPPPSPNLESLQDDWSNFMLTDYPPMQ